MKEENKLIGIIPSTSKTFEVYGFMDTKDLIEGKLYINPSDNRLYYYSLLENRSNPNTGYFPVWDGKTTYESSHSNNRYLNEVTKISLNDICTNINQDTADRVLYNQRKCENSEILKPEHCNEDNMFTQCIKSILNKYEYTLIDLVDMSSPPISENVISNYYSALTKITFMRLNKWLIWIDNIFHMQYSITVYRNKDELLSYHYPKEVFKTGIVNYDSIIKTNDDAFKKIIKILMIMENITKNKLKSNEVDDYTINNMFTILDSNKSVSAQLFSRFIHMANLSYTVNIFKDKELILEYKES
jgi:hypothetical protein